MNKKIGIFFLIFFQIFCCAEIFATGFLKVFEKNNRYFLELPKELLNKELLLSSKLSEVSRNEFLGVGNKRIFPIVVYFNKQNNHIALKRNDTRYYYGTRDLSKISFQKNNLDKILYSFDIELERNNDFRIEVTNFIKSEIVNVTPFTPKNLLGDIVETMTQIERVRLYKSCLEFKVRYFYRNEKGISSALVHKSFLLRNSKYKPRIYDERIGFFKVERENYSNKGNASKTIRYVNRWDIRPISEKKVQHRMGKVVLPQKQIVFYIDNALPKKWYRYVKAGIEDWNKTFGEIGFENVIVANPYPRNKSFDPDHILNSCFRFNLSEADNAYGLRLVDPRTGEIIQGDILFSQNIINTIKKWIFPQTAACNPKAWPDFSDKIIGEAIQYIVAHEMGHILGLTHNFKASNSYSIKDLRSKSFTDKYGSTPSIMDYARFNYVAQPEDGVKNFSPQIGEYDYFAIKWGYSIIEEMIEEETLNSWLVESRKKPQLRFGRRQTGAGADPTAQSYSLGDNDIEASRLGIQNLKIIVNSLVERIGKRNDDYEKLEYYYNLLITQYDKYLRNVLTHITGVEKNNIVEGEEDLERRVFTKKETQLKSLKFIFDNILNAQENLANAGIYKRLVHAYRFIEVLQTRNFKGLIDVSMFIKLIDNHKQDAGTVSIDNYLNYLTNLILDAYHKNNLLKYCLIKYIEQLNEIVESDKVSSPSFATLKKYAYNELINLKRKMKNKSANYYKYEIGLIKQKCE
jgi:hypothetical protein